ncbi:MAG: hypothetical protein Q9P44_02900 [Anaerolineae bacterium]|nr:hypothetical protein [Anaerolineae bacterium]
MKRVLLITLTFILFSTVQAQDVSEYNRFGVVEGFWFPEQTCDLGVGWERIIFDWAQHQPTSPDDWHTLNVDDQWLQAADACNREVVALLKNTPEWATDGSAGHGLPNGLDLALDDPENYWANFVRRTVEYYASRGVTHFIIWNEPDISSDTYGYEFEGNLEDYFQMLRLAYLVAKEANPAAVIHLAGTTYWHDVNAGRRPYMTRLVERILSDPEAAEYNYYFDVLSLHLYFNTDSVYDIVREMREMLDSNGLEDKAIWINETNAAPTDDPNWLVDRPVFQLDLQNQAAFLVQSVVLGLASGAERIAVYKLYDQQLPVGGESFGILSPADAAPRPAFATWRMISERFNDVESAAFVQTETLDAVQINHATGQQTVVAWAREDIPTSIEVPTTGDKAYRIALNGTITVLRPENGVYRLSLSPATCEANEGCFLGGEPVIIVQAQGASIINETSLDNESVTLEFVQE